MNPSQATQLIQNTPADAGDTGLILGLGSFLEKEMEKETYSSILAWEVPWTEEPGGGLQSMELQRVRHDLATKQQ